MPTNGLIKRTGCFDLAGDEIFINDIVLVKSERTGLNIITGVVELRADGVEGFRVRYNDGYLDWEAKHHDSCYEVVKINRN